MAFPSSVRRVETYVEKDFLYPMIPHKLKLLIIADGDSWAGIESHISALIPYYVKDKNMVLEVLLFAEGTFSCWLRSKGVKTTVIEKTNFFKTLYRLYQHVQKNSYHVIHTHSNVAFYLALCYPVLGQTVWINTQHGKPETLIGIGGLKDIIVRYVVYSAIRYFQHVRIIAVSDDLASWIALHKRISRDKIQVIRNGIFLTPESCAPTYGLREAIGIAQDDFVISIVGRLVQVKGHIYLLEALYRLIRVAGKAADRIKVLVIGNGPLLKDLNVFCREKAIEPNVLFLGYREDTRSLMAISDIIAIPSTHEGIPYVLLEAMWLEKAIIASNVGGLKEVLTHGEDAILFSPKNSNELRDAIISLLGNRKLAKRLAMGAVKTVQKGYSSKRMADETRAEYYKSLRFLQRTKAVENTKRKK